MSRGFPDYEQGALADQLRRACYSVPLNIAEGNTRQGSRECRRFLDTAPRSLAAGENIVEMGRPTPERFPPHFCARRAPRYPNGGKPVGFLPEGRGGCPPLPPPPPPL